jgi:hypothetical protein
MSTGLESIIALLEEASMFRRFGRSTTFANVCSLLALTIAIGTGGAYAANTVFSTDIVDGEVKNADIAGNSITSNRIYPGSVTNTDIGADAVDGSKVFDASISAADLGFASVDSGEIATDAVNGSEVAANAIDSDEILDNSITLFDLANNSVGSPEISTGAVQSAELADNAITAAKIPNGIIRAVEFDGGRSNGTITLNSGFVANGRCRDVGISVPGAEVGDAVLVSVNADLPDGILLSGVRVIDDDVIQGKACNFTGGVFPQLNNIQVAIITITL